MNHRLYKTVLKNQVTTIENTGIYDHKNAKTKQYGIYSWTCFGTEYGKQEFVIIAWFTIAIMQNTYHGKLSETLLHDPTKF